jgi:hypothetical protein
MQPSQIVPQPPAQRTQPGRTGTQQQLNQQAQVTAQPAKPAEQTVLEQAKAEGKPVSEITADRISRALFGPAKKEGQ